MGELVGSYSPSSWVSPGELLGELLTQLMGELMGERIPQCFTQCLGECIAERSATRSKFRRFEVSPLRRGEVKPRSPGLAVNRERMAIGVSVGLACGEGLTSGQRTITGVIVEVGFYDLLVGVGFG